MVLRSATTAHEEGTLGRLLRCATDASRNGGPGACPKTLNAACWRARLGISAVIMQPPKPGRQYLLHGPHLKLVIKRDDRDQEWALLT